MLTYQASCFGKLPVHGDFIRHNAGAELRELDAFLQQGILASQTKFGDTWRPAYETTPPLRFVRHFPKAKRLLCGVLVPSQGKVQRAFPFLVWAALDLSAVRKRPAIVPLVMDEFFTRAEAFVLGGWQEAQDMRGVQGLVERLGGSADERVLGDVLDKLMARTQFGELIESGLGAWDDRAPLLLHNMASLLGPKSNPKFTIALPPVSSVRQAALWMEVAGQLRKKPVEFPTFWAWSPHEARGTGLRCLLVEPTPAHYADLFLPQLPSDTCLLYQEGLESSSLLDKAHKRFGRVSPVDPVREVLAALKSA